MTRLRTVNFELNYWVGLFRLLENFHAVLSLILLWYEIEVLVVIHDLLGCLELSSRPFVHLIKLLILHRYRMLLNICFLVAIISLVHLDLVLLRETLALRYLGRLFVQSERISVGLDCHVWALIGCILALSGTIVLD